MLLYDLLLVGAVMPRHHLLMISLGGSFTVIKIIGIVVLLWTILRAPLGRGRRLFPRIPTVLFLLYYAVQLTSAILRGNVNFDPGEFPKLLSILSLLVITYLMVETPEKLRHALEAMVLIVTFSSYYVYSQYWHFGSMYAGFRTFGGVADDTNYYSLTVVMWLPICFFLITTSKTLLPKIVYIGCLLLLLGSFTLAASRGALLGLGLAVLYLILHSKQRVTYLMLCLCILLPALVVLPSSPLKRLMDPTKSDVKSSTIRLILWDAAWKLFQAHPLAGIGTADFQHQLQEQEEVKFNLTAVHNTYFESLATWGLAGTIPFLAFFLAYFRSLGRIAKQNKDSPCQFGWLARNVQAGILAYLVAAFFLSTWGHMPLWALVFLSFGMMRMADDEYRAAQTTMEPPPVAAVRFRGPRRQTAPAMR